MTGDRNRLHLRRARSAPGALLALLVPLALLACSGEGADRPREPADPADLSARCDAALRDARPASPRDLAWSYRPGRRIGDESEHPLGRIVGAAWTPGRDRLLVLDGMNGRVSVYDAAGRFASAFGRTGGGPGEFEELGGAHGSRPVYNQIAFLRPGYVGIQDLGLLHLFDSGGRFVHRMATTGAQEGPFGVRHLAPFSDSAFLFASSGAMRMESSDPEVRAGIHLLRATVRPGGFDTLSFARIRSPLSRLGAFTTVPPADPYASYYRRTWDAAPPGVLAVASLEHHGVCFFNSERALTGAFGVRAPEIPVDGAEKRRVVDEAREVGKSAGPLAAWDWENAYKLWPRTAPYYVDLVLAPDSTVWAERLLPGNGRMVDLYHMERGYLGSMPPLGRRLPVTFAGRCAFAVHEAVAVAEEEGEDFYGLVEWCPSAPREGAG